MTEEKDALVLIVERNAFYKRMHMLALVVLLLCLLVIGMLVSSVVYLTRNPTHPLYFATDAVSRLLNIVPVSVPNMSQNDVIAWAEEAVERSYAVDFVNYRQQLQTVSRYFTTYGWYQFMKGLTASNNLTAIQQRRMIVLAQMVGQPKIVTEGILAGAYAWKFELPVLVTYWLPPYNDTSKILNPLVVSVIIQRQPILQSYQGLGVIQMIGTLAPTQNSAPPQISATPTNS